MSIYPERSKAGSYTGHWLIEVTCHGKRLRSRASTYEDAQRTEESLKAGQGIPSSLAPDVLTVGKLYSLASPSLYRGRKDELNLGRRLSKAVAVLGPSRAVAHIRRPELEAFAHKLLSTGLNPKTVNRYLAGLSGMFRWGVKADLIAGMPSIPKLTESAGRKAYLPESMTEDFLSYLSDTYGPEYRLMTEVLLCTGMRRGEAWNLEPSEVVDDEIHLTRTKTDSPRSIPLPEGLGASLVRLMREGLPPYRKYVSALQQASKAILAPCVITPHALRHTTATRLTAAGVPTLTVARIMGHRSLRTTQGYTHHETSTLRQALASLAPGNSGQSGHESNYCATRKPLFSGGLGGNRTPVQGFAELRDKPKKS